MADSKKGGTKQKEKVTKTAVSREEFDALSENVSELSGGVTELVGLIKSGALSGGAKSDVEVKEEKEITKASPNKYTVNPEWEDLAREIIGEAVDHTEIEYVKGGGMKFTVVIKEDFSNAPADYLERYKVDRRSKEVGAEGEAGVRVWCEQIRSNLKRPKNVVTD